MAIDIVPGGVAEGDSFFGRDDEVARLWVEIERGRHLLLVSPRRVGKTSLLRHLVERPQGGWTVVYVDLQIVADPIAAIEHILEKLKQQGAVGSGIWKSFVEKLESIENVKIGLDGAALSMRQAAGRRWSSTTAAFIDALLEAARRGSRLVLIVDEFPILIKALVEADKKREAEELLRLFRAARQNQGLGNSFRMIVCGSIGLKPVLRRYGMSADANDLKGFPLGPWAKATANAFLEAIGKARPNLQMPPQIRDEVLRFTGAAPLPYHLQVLLSQIEELRKDPGDLTLDDIATARDSALREAEFDHYFERLDAVFDADELAIALDVLAHLSVRPSSDAPAVEALSRGCAKFKNVLRTLLEDGYITSQREAGILSYRFSNPMLQEYWALTHG